MQSTYNIKEEEPGLVWVQILGEPSVIDSEKLVAEVATYLRQYEGRVDFLIDVQQANPLASTAGNLSYLQTLQTFGAFRAAVFGASPFLERTIRTVLQIARATDRISIFQNEAAARQWLQDHK